MKRTRITNQLTFLEPEDMRAFKACAGLLVQGTRKLAIDANMGSETIAMLREENLREAVISHYHLDHGIWGADVLDRTAAEVLVPSGEERYLMDLQFFLDQTAGPYGLMEAWRRFSVKECGFRELGRCQPYDSGNSLSDSAITIACLDTRGHSPSHRSFYFPADKVLFTGDMGVDRFGPWFGWKNCDLRELVGAIFFMRGLPVNVLLTSHGGMLTSGIREAWDQALARLLEREARVARRLEEGGKPQAIVAEGIFFPRKDHVREPMRSFLTMWDTIMFGHHQEMIAQGGLSRYFPELHKIGKESA